MKIISGSYWIRRGDDSSIVCIATTTLELYCRETNSKVLIRFHSTTTLTPSSLLLSLSLSLYIHFWVTPVHRWIYLILLENLCNSLNGWTTSNFSLAEFVTKRPADIGVFRKILLRFLEQCNLWKSLSTYVNHSTE